MKEASKRGHEPWKAFQARQRNQDIKRDAVLQTAAHMFLEQGYRRTSRSELAKRLQLTVHLGVLEQGMVTYVAKVSVPGAFAVHTRVGALSVDDHKDLSVTLTNTGNVTVDNITAALDTANVGYQFSALTKTSLAAGDYRGPPSEFSHLCVPPWGYLAAAIQTRDRHR